MTRAVLALVGMMVWAGAAFAQCQVPDMAPPTEETSDADRRALYLAFTEFQICHYERGEWRGDYLPGDEVFTGKVVAALRVQRQDLLSRSGLPTQAQFHAVAAQPDRQRAFADMIRYVELAQGCAECATGANAVELETARSALAFALDMQARLGDLPGADLAALQADVDAARAQLDRALARSRDVRDEMTRLAEAFVYPEPEPWFTLGGVRFSSLEEDHQAELAQSAVDRAEREVDEARRRLAEREEFWIDLIAYEDGRLAADIAALVTLETAIATRVVGSRALPEADRIERARLRREIDRRTRHQAARARDAEAELAPFRVTLAEAEAALSAALNALLDLEFRRDARVVRVRTEHADLRAASPEERRALLGAIETAEAEIARLERLVIETDRARRTARQDFLAQAQRAAEARSRLGQAEVLSLLAQAYVEVGASAADLAASFATGGPAGVAAEGLRQVVGNVVGGVTYYDGPRPVRRLGEEGGEAEVERDIHPLSFFESEGYKLAATMPLVRLRAVADLGAALERTRLADYRLLGAMAGSNAEFVSALRGALRAQTASRDAAQALGDHLLQNGARGVARTIIRGAITGVAESAAKEALKIAIAEALGSAAYEDLIATQLLLTQRYLDLQGAGDAYWGAVERLAFARGSHRGLVERGIDGNFIAEANAAFFPSLGLRVELELVEDSDVDPGRVRADLTLGGVALERDGGTTALVWRLPEGSLIPRDQPERLTLYVAFR